MKLSVYGQSSGMKKPNKNGPDMLHGKWGWLTILLQT